MNKDHFIKSVTLKQKVLSFNEDFSLPGLKRINIFIGENNSGKSNIIRAIIGYPLKDLPIEIKFYKEEPIFFPLVNYEREHPYFEIPPFRKLIVQEDYPVCKNERSGMLNLEKIEKRKDYFYNELNKVIDIDDFILKKGEKDFPCCLFDKQTRCISLSPLAEWGCYKFKGCSEDINIDRLGWGTKSVIIIFYNLFFAKNDLIFIEEPEISTHPRLLKKLFDWGFNKRKNCQFFITTHSSLLLDKLFLDFDKEIALFRVYKEGTHTKAELIEKREGRFKMLDQLGFKSSNLLFTNYIIWVEGPSDIYYYEAFLNLTGYLKKIHCGGREIKRGLHYEIMWYGGKIGAHLFEVVSYEDLSILFSFTRKGAIFWDYDKGKIERRHKKIIDILKSNSQLVDNFDIGCTG